MLRRRLKLFLVCAVFLSVVSCDKDNFVYHRESDSGVLSFEGFSLMVSEDVNKKTRASSAVGDYVLFLYDNTGALVWQKSYQDALSAGDVTLPAGVYTLEARSTAADVPLAAFGLPVYGASKDFTIKAGATTALGSITCGLLQAVVTVGYNEEFLRSVTGDGVVSVELAAGCPLEYRLGRSDGDPTFEQREGYFSVNGDDATIVLTFNGSVDGSSLRMRAVITGVKARDRHVATIMKTTGASGVTSFCVEIDGSVFNAMKFIHE